MYKRILTFIGCALIGDHVFSQHTKWELHAGLNIANAIHEIKGHQVVWAHTFSVPHYHEGFVFGVKRRIPLSHRLSMRIGTEVIEKGTRDGPFRVKAVYLTLPIELMVQVLSTRQIYGTLGLSGDLYVDAGYGSGFVESRPQVSAHLGVGGHLYRNVFIEVIYREGLQSFKSLHLGTSVIRMRHQGFAICLIYRI